MPKTPPNKMTRPALIAEVKRLRKSRMTVESAKLITADVVTSIMSKILTGEYRPLPDMVTLEEMLMANRIVDELPPGNEPIPMTADPRIVALFYAFEHYGQDPVSMFRELGFDLVRR
jgi:hypothetical protein